jgi:hypothetical protein
VIGDVTVTVDEADFVGSAWLVAITVTVAGVGIALGAVKMFVAGFIVPTLLFPFRAPFTVQVTAVFAVFVTVGVKSCVVPVFTFTDVGESVMLTGGITVTVVDPVALGLAWLVAVIVTGPAGGAFGAV